MSKKGKITIAIIAIVVVIAAIVLAVKFTGKEEVKPKEEPKEVWVTGHDDLYDKAVTYLEKEANDYVKEHEQEGLKDYKVFIDYEGFGTTEKGETKKYAYMWVLMQSYYVDETAKKEADKVQFYQGASTLYKVEFENDKVVGYELPKSGEDYTESIKELAPEEIEEKVLAYQPDVEAMDKEVEEYYANLGKEEK